MLSFLRRWITPRVQEEEELLPCCVCGVRPCINCGSCCGSEACAAECGRFIFENKITLREASEESK